MASFLHVLGAVYTKLNITEKEYKVSNRHNVQDLVINVCS